MWWVYVAGLYTQEEEPHLSLDDNNNMMHFDSTFLRGVGQAKVTQAPGTHSSSSRRCEQ